MSEAAVGGEAHLSETRLAAGLQEHLPGFEALESCERLSGGASQETYRLQARTADGPRVLALRRMAGGAPSVRQPGRPGLRAEARLLACARAAGVPEPEVLWEFEREPGLGDGFVMEWLDGETLGARIVRSEALAETRPRLAYQCGEILARIHSIDLAATGLDQHLDALPPEAFIEQTWTRYRSFDVPQPMIDYTARWLQAHRRDDVALTLVHSDFRNGNLMVAPAGVVAVLDWELAHVGDPMRDLGWLCTNSWRFGRSALPVGGFGTREDLFRGYASVTGTPVDPERVAFWEVFGSFWWAVGCLEMAQAFRTGPDRSVERAAIGRRTSECQMDCANLLMPGPVDLVAPQATDGAVDMPRADELLAGVRDFLREDVMPKQTGRSAFLARVAANALDVVLRESERRGAHHARERDALRALLDADPDADLAALRWQLIRALRDGSMPLDAPGLADALRNAVANQLAVDQPRYSGLATALAGAATRPGDD